MHTMRCKPGYSARINNGVNSRNLVCSSLRTNNAVQQFAVVQHADISDYWAAADLHCQVFHKERSRPMPMHGVQLLRAVKPFLERIDRVACLQSLDKHARDGAGNCALLLAFKASKQKTNGLEHASPNQFSQGAPSRGHNDPLGASAGTPPPGHNETIGSSGISMQNGLDANFKDAFREAQSNSLLRKVLHMMLNGHTGQGLGIGAEEVSLVGSCFVDNFGDLVPPRALNGDRDGAVGWYKREGVAYISNVAVLPSSRGRGVARQLVEEAHRLARNWGCRSAGLHCNDQNTAAVGLYASMGYRKTIKEPAIMPFLNGRGPDRCHFYIKLI